MEKVKKILKDNILVIVYFVLAVFIELLGVLVTSDKIFIRSPWVFLMVQLFCVVVLISIGNNRARHIVASLMLILFAVLNLVFIVIFEMTETIFDFGMFDLRNDAMRILESVPINFAFFTCTMIALSIFIIFGDRYVRHNDTNVSFKHKKIIVPIMLVVAISLNSLALFLDNKDFKHDIYEKLYKPNESSYAQEGITGNFLSEIIKGAFYSDIPLGDEQQLENFIYKDVTKSNFPEHKLQYNLVSILVESFEWTSFVQDFDLYINGQHLVDETGEPLPQREANELLSTLYPNIYDYYKSSISLTNFYSREKTDISENLSILGSYPTNAYINYDFPDNTLPWTMPNLIREIYGGEENITCKAFHNGTPEFYNREHSLTGVGFDSFYADEQMYKMGMPNYFEKGERNLDGDMIETCKDLMFPTDKPFYTEITTITMHGQYSHRDNLEMRGYYDELAEYGILPLDENDPNSFNHNNFYYYCACVKEFDRALGQIMDELKTRGLIDNTIIMLFGDHNTYYTSLSNYVKDLNSTKQENYTNLFRVPCMIHFPNLDEIITFLNENRAEYMGKYYVVNGYTNSKGEAVNNIQVKKFACTADIVPTLLDLMGINFYTNLYYGHSIFDTESSVLYSRAYNIFITDSIYFSSLNNIKYIREEYKSDDPAVKYAYLEEYDKSTYVGIVEAKARVLLEKLDVCNRIFFNDYFARTNINDPSKKNYEIFYQRFNDINEAM